VRAARVARVALVELRDHPGRTAVTVAGVAVAIATFTLISQLSVSARNGVEDTVTSVAGRGATIAASVSPGAALIDDVGGVLARAARSAGASSTSRVVDAAQAELRSGEQPRSPVSAPSDPATAARIFGVDPGLAEILDVRLLWGRWFTDHDASTADVPIVLSRELGIRLARRAGLSPADLVDAPVWTDGPIPFAFTVAGVMEDNAFGAYVGSSASALVPTAALRTLPSALREPINRITLLALADPDAAPEVAARLEEEGADYLALRGAEGASIDVRRIDGAADFAAATGALVVLLLGIGVLALAAGALGVLNVMVMGVRERVREFGLLRALGAAPREVFLLVLFESTELTVAGGLVGVAAAMVAAPPLAAFLSGSLHGIPIEPVSRSAVCLGAAVSVATGLAAGLLPARRARQLSVLEAIRRP
jgi:putative ABC transport system permease protein